ncbi:MAG TPA: glycosyltransferase [Bacteroidales bacterium]|nr:glycosyltransferase [Bacteroidales bacterium]
MKYNPVIVVVAFNRPRSLERVLYSLSRAKNIENAKLIISIDNKAPENYPVKEIAEKFNWSFGEKQVVYQPNRLGLKKHILTCGSLSMQYGSVIILEDDLFVSPYFYEYAQKALEYYENDDQIGGISLYNHTYEDINDITFQPLEDESDVYFMQFPSSLGQAWTKKHWENFSTWFENHPDISNIPIHRDIINWPETSWKKYFTAFLADTNRYFSFPRRSLTSNFNDQGTHKLDASNFVGQAPLRLEGEPYRFKPLRDSFCVYDSYFELLPEKLKILVPELSNYDFAVDLYGEKDMLKVTAPYVITSKPTKNKLQTFQRALKPHEMNLIFNLKGDDISFARKEDIVDFGCAYKKELNDFFYFYTYRIPGKKAFIYNYLKKKKLISKILK